MATFKIIVLPHHRREDGTYNVKIRVTHNRKTRYVKTPYYVGGADISRRKRNGKEELKIRNQAVIDSLESCILDYRRRLVRVGMGVESWDIDRLIAFLSSSPETFHLDFIEYMGLFADRLIKKGKDSTARIYRTTANAMARFAGRDKVDISEITGNFLRSFENYLRDEPVFNNSHGNGSSFSKSLKPKKESVVSVYMSKVKTVYEYAKVEYNDEDNGVINIPWSPFSKYKIPQGNTSEHRVLSIEQIQKIIDYPYSETCSMKNLGKDIFVLSFALMGINTADLYELGSVEGDFVAYCRKKTRSARTDNAAMEIRIEPEIRGLLAKYFSDGRVFDIRKRYKDSRSFNSAVNSGLHKLGAAIGIPELNSYYARHTMASLCANVLGVDIARVDEMLNHSDSRLRMARVYIKKDFKPLWEANRRLLDLFDWSFFTDDEKK